MIFGLHCSICQHTSNIFLHIQSFFEWPELVTAPGVGGGLGAYHMDHTLDEQPTRRVELHGH